MKPQQYLVITRDFSCSGLLEGDPVNHGLLGKFCALNSSCPKGKMDKDRKAEVFLGMILDVGRRDLGVLGTAG